MIINTFHNRACFESSFAHKYPQVGPLLGIESMPHTSLAASDGLGEARMPGRLVLARNAYAWTASPHTSLAASKSQAFNKSDGTYL